MSDTSVSKGRSSGKARELLAFCRSELRSEVLDWIGPVLEAACESLFEKAEAASTTEAQTRLLGAANILRKSEEDLARAVGPGIDERFRACLQVDLPSESDKAESPERTLQLVDEEELEQTLAISDTASKSELRHTQELYGLNKRLSVLNRGRAIDNESNPLGPLQLGRALQSAINNLPIETPEKVLLLRTFDPMFMKRLGERYRKINETLIEAGILPNLKFKAKRSEDPRRAEPEDRDRPAADVPPETPQTPRLERVSSQQLTDEVRAESAEILDRIKELMAKVKGRPAESAGATGGQPASPEKLDEALQRIQSQYTPERGEVLDSEAVKKRIGRWLAEHDQSMDPDQAQTIELMGMVYDYVRSEMEVAKPVQWLVEQLQLPMMRVALSDEAFFKDQKHPARRFFDTVADAGELWMDDRPERSQTFGKVRQAVEKILSDYSGDPEIFHQLLEDLRKHIQLTSRKAQIAERRHVEAKKGQERLAAARLQARSTIDGLIERYQPAPFARSVLEEAWLDYLALLHLRHGDDSSKWKQAVATARFLAVALKGSVPRKLAEQLNAKLAPAKQHLQRGLSQVGYGAEEIDSILGRVEAGIRWSLSKGAEAEPPPELKEPVIAATERPQEPAPAPLPRVREQELEPEVKQQLARLRLTAFGTWFELKQEQDGPWLKRKLSWYSPVSGHCLFVNNLGQPEELDLIAVAEMLADGRARRFEKPKKPLMDRALDAVLGRLRRLAGGAAEG